MDTYALNINAGKPRISKTWHNCSHKRRCTTFKCNALESPNKACFDPNPKALYELRQAYNSYLINN